MQEGLIGQAKPPGLPRGLTPGTPRCLQNKSTATGDNIMHSTEQEHAAHKCTPKVHAGGRELGRQTPGVGQSLLCPTYAEPPTAPADPATCSSIYLHGLADTAKLVDKAVKDDTNRTRRKHVQEYMDWVDNLQLPKSMQKGTPEDLCVYITQHWIPRHAGSSVGKGRSVTAPSSLAGIRSYLSTV
ncbi:TPA: hypothetical protein ACH3X3_004926 [Trebouxia sp. C0006]